LTFYERVIEPDDRLSHPLLLLPGDVSFSESSVFKFMMAASEKYLTASGSSFIFHPRLGNEKRNYKSHSRFFDGGKTDYEFNAQT
jgi:hypothetical protein